MKKVINIICLIMMLFMMPSLVMAENISVTGISVEKSTINLEIGQTETIAVQFYPNNSTNREIKWNSSNNNVATVNASGSIKGISKGVVNITGTTVDGGYSVKIIVNVSGQSSISSEKYSIMKKENALKESVNYITQIDKKTSVNNFKNNIITYSDMSFYNLSGKIMQEDEIVVTGTRLKLSDNSEYVLSVTGDVNSDGNVSIIDLSRFKTRIVGISTLDDFQEVAADINCDGKVTLTDLSNLKLHLVGLK